MRPKLTIPSFENMKVDLYLLENLYANHCVLLLVRQVNLLLVSLSATLVSDWICF